MASASLRAERNQREVVAKHRYKYGAAKKALDAAYARLGEVEEAIYMTPAEGLHGLAIKLAVTKFGLDLEDMTKLEDTEGQTTPEPSPHMSR